MRFVVCRLCCLLLFLGWSYCSLWVVWRLFVVVVYCSCTLVSLVVFVVGCSLCVDC